MQPDNFIKRRAKKVVDAGMSIPLAHLTEQMETNDKLSSLLSKEVIFPEIPEFPSEISISNLPETQKVEVINTVDVQKVEITNLPEEKDNTEELQLLKEIASELKKKEDYAYDIEIDSTLKEQLKGDKGEQGEKGENGSPDTPEQVRDKIESLEGEERLDVNALRGTEALVESIAKKIAKEEVKKVKKEYIGVGNSGGSGSPGGNTTEIQFNDGGSFNGDAGLIYNKTTDVLTVNGAVHTPIVQAHTSAGLIIESQGGADVALFGAGGGQNATFYDGVKLNAQTPSRILSTDASSNITALDTATYPSLTELSYVKGVTSSIQTQFGNKQDTLVSGTNIKTINGNSILGSGNLSISGGSLTKGIAEVDFGAITQNNDIATVSVADATVTTTSYPSVAMYAIATTDHDPDDYMAEGLIPYITNVQNGVGFDISVRAPNLTWGKYRVTYAF